MLLENIIYNEVKSVINEIYKVPKYNILELGKNAISKKKRYARQLWSMIQRNYAYIGGCKSFKSINGDDGFTDFLYGSEDEKYIWRLYFGETSKDLMGAIIYKANDFGRKRIVSVANDAETYKKLMEKDFNKDNHVYGEVSGKSEHFLNKDKRTNWIDKNVAAKILNKKVDLEQNAEIDKNERIPYNSFKHYYRDLGGEKHRKAMFGHPIMSNV